MKKRKFYTAMKYLSLTLLAFMTAFPIVWLFLTSIKTERQIFASPPELVFVPNSASYQYIASSGIMGSYFVNSVIVSLLTVMIALAIGSMCAFALVRLRMPGSGFLASGILMFQMVPPVVLVVPLYVLMSRAGIINTHGSLILAYTASQLPFCIWLLSSYFASVPEALEEAALIDGANMFQIYWRVVLPITLPGLFATAIFVFINSWNEFLLAVNLTTSPTAQTMPIAVTGFIEARGVAWNNLAAAACIMLVPGLLFGIFARKYLVDGLTTGAVK
jgi:ABC-type glycerol-3-phosphate transport system permease component